MKISLLAAFLSIILSSCIGLAYQQQLDAIQLLSSCGSQCWTEGSKNPNPETINPEPESFDVDVVRCMQVCFAAKTKKPDVQQNLPPIQIQKIKVSSYCGHVCFNNNKSYKKSLDYCYAGCLGTILQPRLPKQQMGQKSTLG